MSDKKIYYPVISIKDEHASAPSETVIHVKAASKPVEDDELIDLLMVLKEYVHHTYIAHFQNGPDVPDLSLIHI